MYCIFNFTMATYYTIHMQDLPSGTEHYFSTEVFESFDDACDALDKEIAKHDKNFVKPDRAKMRELTYSPVYHRMPFKMFGLMERTFVPKKPTKKYVYQYFVRSNEQTTSPKYETFDEVCDVLDKELRKLHGESWQPRMTREQYKNYMGDDAYAISYDFFNRDTYVLFRTEV